jgi:hypothetical protein
MLYAGFCGPSNPSQSLQADCERLVNMYVERVESPFAPAGAALYPTPGFETLVTTADNDARGGFSVAGRCFAVIGTGFYELFYTNGVWSSTKRGTVATNSNPATISYNGAVGGQLFVTSGDNGYCYNMTSHAFDLVLTGNATMAGFINNRFVVFGSGNGRNRFSALNDGTSFGASDYFVRSQAPDPQQSMLINGSEIWLIGEQTGEVWYDSGATPNPYAPIPGAAFRYGTAAPFSASVAGDYVVWLSQTREGVGSIVAARGYTPQPISNFAVDTAIGSYAREDGVSDAEVMVYTEDGHTFANFSFPTARRTWAVDLSMDMLWGERGKYDFANGQYNVWSPRFYMYAFNMHLVGLRGTGAIAKMDRTLGSEADGSLVRRLRIPPPLWVKSPRQRIQVSRFELLAETGLGLTTGQGSNPLAMLRTSKDAKTWGSELTASVGRLGDYGRRVVWNRLGSSDKLWVPELTVTDPIPWRISGATIEGTGFEQARAAA